MFVNKTTQMIYSYALCLSSSFAGYSIFSVQRDVKEFALLLRTGPSLDGCRQGGHGRHARTAQSDHSIDVLGARIGRHVNVLHPRDWCHWRVVIGEPLEEQAPIHHFWGLRGKLRYPVPVSKDDEATESTDNISLGFPCDLIAVIWFRVCSHIDWSRGCARVADGSTFNILHPDFC